MKYFSRIIFIIFVFIYANSGIFAQENTGVMVVPRISAKEIAKDCKNLEIGEIVFFQHPELPAETETPGLNQTVNITIKVDEIGVFTGIEKAEGQSPFLEIGIKAAQKIKFTPTKCNDQAIPVKVVMTYIFNPVKTGNKYYVPENIEGFKDVNKESEFYEPILLLTENYKISFGYADKNFYENAFLTKGDFAHFLRLTLDYLSERAKFIGKDPYEIKLIRPYNPQKLISFEKIKDLDKNDPSTDSFKILFQKYKIALVSENFELTPSENILQNELIEIWTKIFGQEALPIHFDKTTSDPQKITRGEFALFLQESLGVLSYKVLP